MPAYIPQAGKRRAEYGLKAIYIYPMENGVYGTPFRQLGARALNRTSTQDTSMYSADDTTHITVVGKKVIEGTLTFYQLDEAIRTQLLGDVKNANNAYTDSGFNKTFGIAYVTDVEDSETHLHAWKVTTYYNCIATAPDDDSATIEETAEPTEKEISFTASVPDNNFDINGNPYSSLTMYSTPNVPFVDIETLLMDAIPTAQTPIDFPDTVAPTFSAPVMSTFAFEQNAPVTYEDLRVQCGVTATDDRDGNVNTQIKYTEGVTDHASTDTIDTTALSATPIEVVLTVEDLAGNISEPLTLTYTVIAGADITAPVIVTTADTISVVVDTVVDKAYQVSNNGLSVIDDVDGDITSGSQVVCSTVDTSTVGTLTQTVTATDTASNEATKDITVEVTAVTTFGKSKKGA